MICSSLNYPSVFIHAGFGLILLTTYVNNHTNFIDKVHDVHTNFIDKLHDVNNHTNFIDKVHDVNNHKFN